MAFRLRALLGERSVLQEAARSLRNARLAALVEDLVLLPLIDGPADGAKPFPGLAITAPAAAAAKRASLKGPVAYIEADYSSGKDFQAAVVWTGGEVSGGPATDASAWDPREPGLSERPVNSALRLLGVGAGECADEWDAVGLARYPTTEAWAAQGD